jgi:choline kinase
MNQAKQAVVLAAGVGNRLAGTSGGLPKSYLRLGGETLLERNIRLLRDVGVSEIVLVTGHQRERFAADFPDPGIRQVFNPFYRTSNVLVSFWCALPFLHGDFLYLHADTVFAPQILGGLAAEETGEAILAVDRKVCGEEEMKYTLAEDGSVDRLNKTMPPGEAAGEFLGLARFSASTLPRLRGATERILGRGEFQCFVEAALQEMVDDGELVLSVFDTGDWPWREIDFPEDYEAALRMFPDDWGATKQP